MMTPDPLRPLTKNEKIAMAIAIFITLFCFAKAYREAYEPTESTWITGAIGIALIFFLTYKHFFRR